MMRTLTVIATAVVALASVPAVEALEGQDQDSKILSNRLYLTAGGYIADFRTDAAIGSGTLLTARVGLEDDLGVDDANSDFRFAGLWRFKRKHAIQFSYVAFRRSGGAVIDESITIGNPPETFPIGADVFSIFDNQVYSLNYEYSFFNNGKVNTGFAAGLTLYEFDIDLEGSYTVGQTQDFSKVVADVVAPIPTMGFFTQFAITPRVILQMQAGFLDLETGDYDGRLVETKLVFDWFFTKHVSIGGGFASSDLRFANLGEDPWRVDYRYGGFLLYFGGVWGK
jgi:hypothetical protein